MISFEGFVALVQEMRLEQRLYFKERTIVHLQKAKVLERRVDLVSEELVHMFNCDGSEQLAFSFPNQ